LSDFKVEDWGGYANCYDSLNQLKPYQELQKKIVSQTILDERQMILDAACGTGNFAFWANKIKGGNGSRIIGVDFSDEMLTRAKKKCDHLYQRIIKTDLNEGLLFGGDSFDQIVSTLTLYTVRNPKALLLEFYRILKPGGLLILSSPLFGYENGLILKEHCQDKGSVEPWLDIHRSSEHEKMIINKAVQDSELAAKLIAIASHNRHIKNNCKFYFPQKDELIHLFFNCGFQILKNEMVYSKQDLLIVASKEEIG
jgi:ubiquinone/menaquinone biosynthesis C-methylase UbiE